MKNLNLNYIPVLPIACLLTATSPPVKAQQLPNVQTVGVLAPPQVKTDGKATEWGSKFEAYNKAASMYYTMANDNEKLYLTIQVADTAIIERIINSGITLTIKGDGKGGGSVPLIITYPLNNIQQIKVTGIKATPDSLISTTNNLGIEAAALSYQKKYTYELAISLKYLVPLINDIGTFNYNVMLNAATPSSFSGKYTLVIN
ncbi:MAG: hypothetical protein ABIN91_20390 [Mucilaginibacter sp.]|uniref:hypothetical protein n=1 Tax=Mucilaginibacter sp. TaxID=1882438 RepID=UPI00326394F8